MIRAAYRALARLYHPDVARTEAADDRMALINRAWTILGDAASRSDYDRRRRGAPAAETEPPTQGWAERHAARQRPAAGWGAGAAGPPPGRPSGSVVDFGIYLGWTLGEIEWRDPGYLDWLVDRPEGLPYRNEILQLQARRRGAEGKARRGMFGFG